MKRIASVLSILSLALTIGPAWADDASISALQDGGLVQTSDYIGVVRSGCIHGGNCKVKVGSAASQNTGTSGASLGLLNTANTYSALQTFLAGDLAAADPIFTGGAISLPSGVTGARPGSPVAGMIRYNTTTPGFEGYSAGAWGALGGGGSMVYPGAGIPNSTGSAWGTSYAVTGTGNVVLSASPTLTGTIAAASETLSGTLAVTGAITGNLTGNASTATALASAPSQCSGGQFSKGVDTGGNANCSTPSGSGNVSGQGSSTNLYIPQWSGTSGTSLGLGLPVGTTGNSTIVETDSGGHIIAAIVPALNQNTTGNAATVTTNANLTGPITSVGNATSVALQTGTGSTFAMAASPAFTGTVTGAAATWSGVSTALNFAAAGTGADTLPVGTTGQRPSPANGMLRYNSTVPQVEAYYSGAWNALGTVGAGSITAIATGSSDILINGGSSPCTSGNCTVSTALTLNPQGGTTPYAILAGDMGKMVTNLSSSPIAISIPQAGTTGFALGSSFFELNYGTGVLTQTPTTSTINGSATEVLHQYGWNMPVSDGSNWYAIGFPGFGTVTTNALGKFIDASGAETASSILDNGTFIATAEPVAIGTTASPTAGSIADFGKANSSIILPTGTTVQRPTPTAGMFRYNSDTPGMEAYYNSMWNQLGTGSGGNPTCTTGQMTYYAAGGSTTSCLTLGTNLSITGGTISATGGGSGTNPSLQPASSYTSDTAGNLFPYVYVGAGGNASAADAGWGVASSLSADTTLQLRFQMPPSIPGTGSFKLKSYCQANASSGVAKYTISDADVAAASSPSAATLTSETQTSITWSAADVYVVTSTTLSSTPHGDDVSVVAVTFNHTSWTLASIMSCRWIETWE